MDYQFSIKGILGSVLLLIALPIPVAHAASKDAEIYFRPKCEQSGAQCAQYHLYDRETLITTGLDIGDMIDVDIVLSNPSQQPIQSIQSWLKYDPKVLEGVDVRINDIFPLVAPGEKNFVKNDGIVKLGASNVEGGLKQKVFIFATLTFRVIAPVSESEMPSEITFHEFNLLGNDGKTKAFVVEEGKTVNILKTRPKDLRLYFGNEDPPPNILPPDPIVPGQIPSPSPSPTPTPNPSLPGNPQGQNPFGTSRPQNLRITTKDDMIYIRWSPFSNKNTAGYNVYYGTVSGRYVHRRTVGKSVQELAIGPLPVGQRVYTAITAYAAGQHESDYSDEVAVVVGDSATATSPLMMMPSQVVHQPPPPSNVLDGSVISGQGNIVPAETGFSILYTLILLSFGSIVFFFARRRIHDRRII